MSNYPDGMTATDWRHVNGPSDAEEALLAEVDDLRERASRTYEAAEQVGRRAEVLEATLRPALAVTLEAVANYLTEMAEDDEREACYRQRDIEDGTYYEPDPDALWDSRFDD